MEVANCRRSPVFTYKNYKLRVNLQKWMILVKTSWMLKRLQLCLRKGLPESTRAPPMGAGSRAEGPGKAN